MREREKKEEKKEKESKRKEDGKRERMNWEGSGKEVRGGRWSEGTDCRGRVFNLDRVILAE